MTDVDPYSRQYHHAFRLGLVLQAALAILWSISGNIAFGVLSVVNVCLTLFVFPFALTWLNGTAYKVLKD